MSGSLALGATHIAKILLRLVSSMILTRLLYPEAFGYMALVMSAVVIINLSTDIGIKPFMIRYTGVLTRELQNVIWTLKCLRGLVLYGFMLSISGWLAGFYGDEKIKHLLQIVATSSLISSITPLSLYWAEKEKKFAFVAGAEFAAFLVQTAVVLLATAIFRSYWCLALGAVANQFTLFCIASHINNYQWPKFALNREHIKEIWSFIKWITFGSFVFVAVMQMDRFVIGKAFSAEILGYYAIALTIAEALTTMSQNIANRVGFPTWADAKKRDEHRQSFAKFSQIFLPLAGAASGALFFMGDEIVSILYDKRYAIAGGLLSILCVRAVLMGLLTTTVDLLIVDGRSRAMFTANVIRLVWVVLTLGVVMFGMQSDDVRLYALIFALMDVPAVLFYAVAAKGYRGLFIRNIAYAVAGLAAGGLLGYLGSYVLSLLIAMF